MAKRADDEPNLELPSFRLRRHKKERRAEAAHAKRPPAPPRKVPAPPSEPEVLVRRKPAPPLPVIKAPPAPPAVGEPIVRRKPPAPPTPKVPARKAEKNPRPEKTPKPAKVKAPKPDRVKKERKRRRIRLPRIPGPIAALVIGGLMGALTVSLAFGTAKGCDAVRGVGTCGGFGLFALVAILGLDVVLGAALLRLCRVGDAVTTAVLGVGLVAVLAMLFFLGSTDSPAMAYVIPTLMAVTFAGAQWLTNAIATKINE